ncbi:MAG: AAA family ATPase [Protaetiibacter sp.]
MTEELARLVAMREGATENLADYRGEPWDATLWEVARRLSEFANSDWARLSWADVERLLLEYMPTDDGFTNDAVREKIARARSETTAQGKTVKTPLELRGKASPKQRTARKAEPEPDRDLKLVSLAGVEFLITEWAWDETIPLGTLTGVAGWAGIGKSSLVANLVAKWTRGELPGELSGEPTSVVMVAGEDDTARQLAPRLAVAGADLHRVFVVQATRRLDSGVEVNAILNLEEDLPRIREQLIATGSRVLILDPILSFVSGDPNHQRDVRAALDPLAGLARELNIAVVLVMHFKKGTGAAGEKVSGSHVWRDALRSLLVMAKDKESGYRVLTLDKSNYGPAGRSMMFEVTSVEVTGRNSKGELRPSRVSLATYVGESAKSVDDILNEEQTRGDARHKVDSDTAEIIAWIIAQPNGARWVDICEEAGVDANSREPEEKKARENLSAKLRRAVKRGDLSKDVKGLYRRPPTLQPMDGLTREDF